MERPQDGPSFLNVQPDETVPQPFAGTVRRVAADFWRVGAFRIAVARRHARKQKFASHEGVRKGSRRSVSVSGPKETRDQLPHDRVFRLHADFASGVTLIATAQEDVNDTPDVKRF